MNKVLKQDLELSQDGDDWGWSMSCLFAIADVLYDEGLVPDEWHFRQSPFGPNAESWEYQRILDLVDCKYATLDDVLEFGNILNRYCDILRAQGRDY